MPISLPQEASSLRTGSHQRMILACTRPILVGHAVELATAQPPPTTTARSKPTPRLAQHHLRQLRARGSTQADDEPGMDAAGDHADPGHPSRTAAYPTAALQDLTSAGHSGRGNAQTPDAHTGRRHRTPDSGHLDPQTPAPDTGHRSRGQPSVDTGRSHRTPDTGHWTPDTGRGRGQADEGAAGIRTSWATTPSDRALGRPTVFLWTAPAALGSPCRLGGEAAFQREIASRRQLLGRSAGVERRLGALLSSDECRVERRANGDASSVMANVESSGDVLNKSGQVSAARLTITAPRQERPRRHGCRAGRGLHELRAVPGHLWLQCSRASTGPIPST
jgi:hypothetical protein